MIFAREEDLVDSVKFWFNIDYDNMNTRETKALTKETFLRLDVNRDTELSKSVTSFARQSLIPNEVLSGHFLNKFCLIGNISHLSEKNGEQR